MTNNTHTSVFLFFIRIPLVLSYVLVNSASISITEPTFCPPLMYLKEALSKYQEIIYNVEFARDLQKSFLAMGQEVRPSYYKCHILVIGSNNVIIHFKRFYQYVMSP